MTDPLPAHLFHLPPGYSVAIIPPEQDGWELLEWTVTQPPASDDPATCGLQPTPSTSLRSNAKHAAAEPVHVPTTSTMSLPQLRNSANLSTQTLLPSQPMLQPCPNSVAGRVVNLTSTRTPLVGISNTSTLLAPRSPLVPSVSTPKYLTASSNFLSTPR
uniref:p17 n=1 Tax=Nudaurelia capensis omega virus TaxID=12541 RepID=Q4TVU9_9VIRU|nr:p17 [Nudaurelia capensis omega virus]AAY54576.1 p17 [Nudaurelia capensis omega virus]